MNSPSPVAALGIGGIALVVAALFVAGVARAGASRRTVAATALGALAWLGLWAVVARSGVLLRFDARPPPILGMMLASGALGVILGLSRIGGMLTRLPLALLVGVHAFRLPLELAMHRAATDGIMPVQMSYGGDNFDIVSGASALVVGGLLAVGAAPRWLVVAWNVVGATLLAVIVTIAATSMPMIHAFGEDPSRLNTFIGEFPFVWLPTVLVAAALAGHIVVARRLLADRRSLALQRA